MRQFSFIQSMVTAFHKSLSFAKAKLKIHTHSLCLQVLKQFPCNIFASLYTRKVDLINKNEFRIISVIGARKAHQCWRLSPVSVV